jgi:hypothetical protein
VTLHPPPEIQNGVAPASARADAGRSSKRPTDEITAGSRGRRVAIFVLRGARCLTTVDEIGSYAPRRLFVVQAFSPRHHCGRVWRVIAAWSHGVTCAGVYQHRALESGRFCSLIRARVWGKGMAHWLGGERAVGANKQIQDCLFEIETKGSCRRQR